MLDVGTLESGAPYMVMEYLEGEDLAGWLRDKGPLPVEQAVDFVLQACVAVADAHALGIVHRDLKPANLFCVRRSDGQLTVKVIDFGISKLSDLAVTGPGTTMTKTLAVIGSPLYMSPEQMQSPRDVDALTDIWALGVVLFELLTGRVPFRGETYGQIAVKVATQSPPSMRELRADMPPGLEGVIQKCLQADRTRRYGNVAKLAHALMPFGPQRARVSVDRVAGILHAAGLSTSADVSPPPEVATHHRPESIAPVGHTSPGIVPRGPVAVAGALGVLAVLGVVGGLAATSRGGAPSHGATAPPTVWSTSASTLADEAKAEGAPPPRWVEAALPPTVTTLVAVPPVAEPVPPVPRPPASLSPDASTGHKPSARPSSGYRNDPY